MLSGVKIIPKEDQVDAPPHNKERHRHRKPRHHHQRHEGDFDGKHGMDGRDEEPSGSGEVRREGWMHMQDDPQPSPSHNNVPRPARMKIPVADPLSGWKKRVLPNSPDARASELASELHKERHEEQVIAKPIKETAPAVDGDCWDNNPNNILNVKKPATFADALERARRRNAGTSTLNPLGAIGSSSHSNSSTLPLIQADGKPAPGAFGRETARGREETMLRDNALNRKRLERYDGGQRVRYYAEDDSTDLTTLVRQTKYEGVDDIDATMANNIVRNARFRAADVLDVDAEYDEDVGLDLADRRKRPSKRARKMGQTVEEAVKRDKQRQTREFAKYMSVTDRCEYCVMSPARQKHLTVAVGTASYLALPPRGRLCAGHCQIVAAEHISCTRVADDVAWTEMRNFKKCLLQMFAAQGKECIFMETFINLSSNFSSSPSHAVVDCIPVDAGTFARGPAYFRKAFEDATSDWAQHAAKKCISTGGAKGLKESIPPNFPYFYVEFGLRAGMLHVIDDVEGFDRQLGRRVLVGLMRLPEELMHRRATKESEVLQRQWVEEFRTQFDLYDWTKELQV